MRKEVYDLLPLSSRIGYWAGVLLAFVPFLFAVWAAALAYGREGTMFWWALGAGFAYVAARRSVKFAPDWAFAMRGRMLRMILRDSAIPPVALLNVLSDKQPGETMRLHVASIDSTKGEEYTVFVASSVLVQGTIGRITQPCVLLRLADAAWTEPHGSMLLVPPLVLLRSTEDKHPRLRVFGLVSIGEPMPLEYFDEWGRLRAPARDGPGGGDDV